MTTATQLTRLRRRIVLWLAVLMVVSGGLASGLSHGALRTSPAAPWLTEICTTPQVAAGAGHASWTLGEQHDPDNGVHTLLHCPLCMLGSHAFGPPAAAVGWWPLSHAVMVPTPWQGTRRHAATPTWRPLPRGPPARQPL